MLTEYEGEDKKALIAMLGKLYITSKSSAGKLHATIALVGEAIDDRIANDAASRAALNKLHLALGKAIRAAGEAKSSPNDTLAGFVLSTIEDQEADELVLDSDQDIKVEMPEVDGVSEAKDSLLEELLDDDEDL